MSEQRCRHDLLEDCPDCLRDEIERLTAELTSVKYHYGALSNAYDAAQKQLVKAQELKDDVLSVLHTYRDYEPEEGESWESWYYAAFDLACGKIREVFKSIALTDETHQSAMSDLSTWLRWTSGELKTGPIEDGALEAGMIQCADEIDRLRNQLGKRTSALEKIIEMWGGCSVYHAHHIARTALSSAKYGDKDAEG